MKGTAQGYLDINKEDITSLVAQNRNDPDGFNRDVLEHWARSYSGDDKVNVSNGQIIAKINEINQLRIESKLK